MSRRVTYLEEKPKAQVLIREIQMGEIRAAGFVIFRRLSNQIQYLLMQASYEPFHWTPPKGILAINFERYQSEKVTIFYYPGHVEEGEDNMETAKRETKEEAGIDFKDLKLTDFTKSLRYEVKGKPKVSVYFLAELVNPDTPVILSHEHKAFDWLQIDDACKSANFADMQELLNECQAYIDKV
ncbi:Hypothetical predicted protein [Cloeon dipterum]|uniref:Bis(5'-nucleosyl)-tetraphosphatase [asymmetrical] n=1 Tax=Cloeon dipterum TaxID=197152 RepID=A0A8S1CMW4_9INSE|nr:Hypothetical predicted protein [Cloeon dipterum]